MAMNITNASQQPLAFSKNQFGHMTPRRRLAAFFIDFYLRFDGNGLVWRQRIDGEKTRRMAGQPVQRHHSNPFVHGALLGCAAGAIGLTLGNALQLTWDEGRDWVRILLLAVTAVTVSTLHMPLLLVLVVFGGIGIVHEYARSRAARNG